MNVGETLKQLRIAEGLTQKEIAQQLKIGQSAYARYENGSRDVPLDILVKLTKIFKVASDYLLGIENWYFGKNITTKIIPSKQITIYHHWI